RDNLDGLHWILPQLDGKPAGSKPKLRTHSPEKAVPRPAQDLGGALLEGHADYRRPPITVECRVTLRDARGYNILVASDTKKSGDHWELFSMNGGGTLTAYMPGLKPDHVRSQAMICDGKPHTVTMIYEPRRVRLLVDGETVADQRVQSLGRDSVPGALAIGRLVEGGLGCRGEVQWARISRGARDVPAKPVLDVAKDQATLLLWRRGSPSSHGSHSHDAVVPPSQLGFKTPEYSPEFVASLIEKSQRKGDAHRGLLAFANSRSACLSCHRVGRHGGVVGPDLTIIGKQRKPRELVESVLWPKRCVKPEYVAHLVIDESGHAHQGYIARQDKRELVLRDPSKSEATEITFSLDEIEGRREVGTLMPDNLVGAMTDEELGDLLKFLFKIKIDFFQCDFMSIYFRKI
ncbi:MAG: hypothetical protein N2C14_23580, partial [Planctomycetales bacterium]